MYKTSNILIIAIGLFTIQLTSCKVPQIATTKSPATIPTSFTNNPATDSASAVNWKNYFTDPHLVALIDTAITNNQELLKTFQEIEIARNEIGLRHAALIPSVTAGGGAGIEKVGRYTSQGAGDATTEIKPGKEMPDPLGDFVLGVDARWEIDIWKKLRTAKKAALLRYLSSVEGKNFLVTNLVAEIASSYYELLALDNQLQVLHQNITLQKNALEIVKVQKEAARATELAVQKFQAEVLRSQSMEFGILQHIREVENRINLLAGRYPQPIVRNQAMLDIDFQALQTGIPSQLLTNRADIRQAELALEAAKLDVKVARAEFLPSLELHAGIGVQAFNPAYLVKMPESILYSLAGDLAGPIINRNAIKAEFNMASARQLQSLYEYDRTVLNAFLDVTTGLSRIDNLQHSFEMRTNQVNALTRSIDVANDLFKAARADYFEVLMTQRDALEAKLELIETRKDQMLARIQLYKDLGGGWR